jgi:hypothetical protein
VNSTHCADFTICVCKSSLDIAVSLVANCWQCRLLVRLPHLSIYINIVIWTQYKVVCSETKTDRVL